MTARTAARLRVSALVVVALLVQATVASDLRVRGVAPDLLLLCAACAGMTGGGRQGALVGFAAGLLSDLYVTATPVGLSALVMCLVGYGIGSLRENVLPEGWLLAPLLAVVGTGAGVVLFVGIGDIVGQSQLVVPGRSALVRVAAGEAAWSALLSLPAVWAFARATRGSNGAASLDRGRPDVVAVR